MATITVWKFDSADGAERAEERLVSLAKRELIKLDDAAVVTWPPGRKKPKTRQAHHLAAGGALGGAFWGLLFGLIFFVPLLGLAIGAGMGAITGGLSDVGIDDDFINDVKTKIGPGTSALFVLSSDAVLDKVSAEFSDMHGELIQSNLSADEEAKLRHVFGEDE